MPQLKYYAAARPGDKYWTILQRPNEKKIAVTYTNANLIVDALNFHDRHLREKEKQAKVKTAKKK